MIISHSWARRAALIGGVLAIVVTEASSLRPAATKTAPQIQSSIYPQLIRVWVHGENIYPPVARARPGKILLRAENQTQSDLALVLENVLPGKARLNIARLSTVNRALRADSVLSLVAGEYEFYDEAFPEVKGKLIVGP